MKIGLLIFLTGITLVLSMRIHDFEVRDPCEFVLDAPSALLFNDFRKETYEEPREFYMFAHMGNKIGCNL